MDRYPDGSGATWPTAANVAGALALGAGGVITSSIVDVTMPRTATALVATAALVLASTVVLAAHRSWVVALVAGLVGAGLATATGHLGVASFLVAGVVIAGSAFVEPRALGLLPHRQVERVTLSFPLLAAAQLSWMRSTSVSTALALLGAATALVVLSHVIPRLWVRSEAAVARLVGTVAHVVGIAALAIVAVPTLYLPGAFLRLHQRWHRRRPVAWSDVSALHDLAERDARVPFVSAPPRSRWLRSLLGIAVLAALVAGFVVARRPPPEPPLPRASEALDALGSTAFSSLPAFRSQAGAVQLEQESDALAAGLAFDPVTGSKLADHRGTSITVIDGVRRTKPSRCRCPRITMWLVGGSAAFGLGQRDDRTLASALVEHAADDSIALDVVSLGTPLWTLWSSHLAVMARLASGEPPPDLAVYYGGFDDVLATVALDAAGARQDREPPALFPGDLDALLSQRGTTGRGEDLGRRAAAWYRGQAEIIDAQLSSQDIRSTFVLQPDLLGSGASTPTAPTAEALARTDLAPALIQASRDLDGLAIDLRAALIGHEDTFFDTSNVNEEGAALAARTLHRRLRPAYREVQG